MIESISDRYRRGGALVDTNLMVLLAVGRYDRNKIKNFRATQKYSTGIYDILESFLSHFLKLHTTVNVLTEVDNLSRLVSKSEWAGISAALALAIDRTAEETFSSHSLLRHSLHPQIGITDCSIFEMSDRDILVVTDDLPLTVTLERHRRGVINLSRYLLDEAL